MMGTRGGSLDPGVVLYLMDQRGMDAAAIEKLLYSQSGLLGVSGISSDMRTLLASDEPRARLAVDLYCYRIRRELGSLAAALGGLDALVFTAGIGENSAADPRAPSAATPRWLGVELDEAANAAGAARVSAPGSRVERVAHRHQRRTDDRQRDPSAPHGLSCRRTRTRRERPDLKGEQTMDALNVATKVLAGRKALVIGVANEHSIAWGCAKAFHELGAEVALTYLNEKSRPFVEPLARSIGAPMLLPLDVEQPGQMEAVFERIAAEWGRLDIAVHSIAWAPKADLQGGLLSCSAEGFSRAMDVSCHSFIRMARLAAPLMSDGGTLFAMSYYGAEKVVDNYNLMGPVKAALEASCRYLAFELGGRGIRVHPISPGPLKTRAASGLKDFDLLLNEAAQKAPVGELVDIMDVGFACAFLATPYARRITGGTIYVDGGVHVVA